MTWNADIVPNVSVAVTEFPAAMDRPVYILGAGFSKAISSHMPITDELGQELQRRLKGKVDIHLSPGQTFEEWLTIQTTPLPFLEGYENSQRQANAARVIAEIASILHQRVELATAGPIPKWLRQLIALWDAEHAVILTFNYDPLIERAVNTHMPVTGLDRGYLQHVQGDYVVFPAPPAPAPQLMGDMGEGHTDKSFQVLKLHGSISWYWANGDASGSTLVRVRDRHTFGSDTPFAHDTDYSATTTLDRYLIPPVTSKEGYYGTYLANGMWRKARDFIAEAPRLTMIGYSLPPEDRVTNQLVAQTPDTADIYLVDLDPKSVETTLAKLGKKVAASTLGSDCVMKHVEEQIAHASTELVHSLAFLETQSPDATVLIGISQGWNSGAEIHMYVPGFYDSEQVVKLHPMMRTKFDGEVAPHQAVFDQLPEGLKPHTTMLTVGQVFRHLHDGQPFHMEHPHTGEQLVAIGARRFQFNGREAVELKWTVA